MSGGLPGLAGTDHVGFTVPDLEAATRFFVDVIGCVHVYEIGPFQSDDDWMRGASWSRSASGDPKASDVPVQDWPILRGLRV